MEIDVPIEGIPRRRACVNKSIVAANRTENKYQLIS